MSQNKLPFVPQNKDTFHEFVTIIAFSAVGLTASDFVRDYDLIDPKRRYRAPNYSRHRGKQKIGDDAYEAINYGYRPLW